MYTPSNQIINFCNRDHNLYRLYKKKEEKRQTWIQQEFYDAIFTMICVLGVFENLVIYSKQNWFETVYVTSVGGEKQK